MCVCVDNLYMEMSANGDFEEVHGCCVHVCEFLRVNLSTQKRMETIATARTTAGLKKIIAPVLPVLAIPLVLLVKHIPVLAGCTCM